MKHTYTVTGMTCSGCKASVEKALQSIDAVEHVEVNLETSSVDVTMSEHISTEKLQNALASKYTISEKNERNVFKSSIVNSEPETSDLKQLFPLFLIFGYIVPTLKTDLCIDLVNIPKSKFRYCGHHRSAAEVHSFLLDKFS